MKYFSISLAIVIATISCISADETKKADDIATPVASTVAMNSPAIASPVADAHVRLHDNGAQFQDDDAVYYDDESAKAPKSKSLKARKDVKLGRFDDDDAAYYDDESAKAPKRKFFKALKSQRDSTDALPVAVSFTLLEVVLFSALSTVLGIAGAVFCMVIRHYNAELYYCFLIVYFFFSAPPETQNCQQNRFKLTLEMSRC